MTERRNAALASPPGGPQDKAPFLDFLERLLFNNRPIILIIFFLLTLAAGYKAVQMRPEASYLRMIPLYHPYIENYLKHQDDLKGLANFVRIAVETTEGDIFTKEYLETLQKINDEIFYISGVNRGALKSLWTPITRWGEITEAGFDGGPVIPDTYDGSEKSCEQVKINVLKSGEVGQLVANNFKSSIILAPLQDIDPETGKPIDYQLFSEKLEEVRNKYQNDIIQIHITGFAKIVGDLIDGAGKVVMFFAVAFMLLLFLLYTTTRCIRNTFVRALSSIVAVIWQLGILRVLGYGLNPYSMLVPFLMFALGVSHGIQMGNAMSHELTQGASKELAARRAYRKIFIAGFAALLTTFIGFATLLVIQIGVIRDIAVGAIVGTIVVALTDLTLLPILLSYTGINQKRVDQLRKTMMNEKHFLIGFMTKITRPRVATVTILIALLVMGVGIYLKKGLMIGDLEAGAPELRPNSRYNLDNAFMSKNYSTSSDVFVVMVETKAEDNSRYETVNTMDQLQWRLRQLEGVQSTVSMVDQMKIRYTGQNEGNRKWFGLPRSQVALDNLVAGMEERWTNLKGTITPIFVFLDDHKAETLQRVIREVELFASKHNTETTRFLLAAGNAGIEATTNIEIEKAQLSITVLVFSVILIVLLFTFRSLAASFCVLFPLYLTSVLCEAVMAALGIGLKVATLPVIAVGVGIGVDYGIYILNMLRYHLSQGDRLEVAYYKTLNTTGRAVVFTGITLGIGVGSWIFSPIKFQADMGLLLTFVFTVNMFGAIFLLPALATIFLRNNEGLRVSWKKAAAV